MLDHLKSHGFSHAVSLVQHIRTLEKTISEHDQILEGYKDAISTNHRLEQELKSTRQRLAIMESEVANRLEYLSLTVWLSDFSTSPFKPTLGYFAESCQPLKTSFQDYPKEFRYSLL